MIQFNQTYSINDGQESIVFTAGKGNTVSGKYNAGTLTGSLEGNLLKATFHNQTNNSAGLIEIDFTEDGFNAKWKQGLEPGPMRGKWKGALSAETRKEEKNKVDITSETLTDEQKKYLEEGVSSWDFEGEDEQANVKKSWLSNRAFLFEAVKQDGHCIQYAPDDLKSDREIILEALKKDGRVLEYLADTNKAKREIVLEAVKKYGRALEFAADDIKADREIVLEAIKNDGRALEFAADVMKANREIVLEAVKIYGRSLEFAADDIKADREIVLEAIKNDKYAIEFVSNELLGGNPEIVLAALTQDSYALRDVRNEAILKEIAEHSTVGGEKINFKVRNLVEGVQAYFNKKIALTEDNEVISDIVKQWFEFNQIIYNNQPMDGDALLSLAQVQFWDYTPRPTDGRTKEEYTESLLIEAIELNDSNLWSILDNGLIREEYTDYTHLAEKACSLLWNQSGKDYSSARQVLVNDDAELREGLSDEFVANIIKEARENNKGSEEEKEDFESFLSDEGLE
jgi:hypothetical protein